jgi:transposase
MSKVALLAIDIAKNIFQLHGADERGKGILKKTVKRSELSNYIAKVEQCTIVMEACGGAHYWARKFQELGHKVKLISPQFVTPFVKSNKNDMHDAQAIAEAASRPDMRFVPIKGLEQQDIQCLHRIRERIVKQKIALSNQIRGLLAEYGVVIAQGFAALKKRMPEIMEDAENELTFIAREFCAELYEEFFLLEQRIEIYDKKMQKIFKENNICQKLSHIEGIGLITATAILTVLSDPKLFKNGRHFAAFLGLVPRQHSSGGKQKLLGISKRGDTYLRKLLVQGARSVLLRINNKTDLRSEWLKQLKVRRGSNRAAVALANKNARIIWAMVANDTLYQRAA